MSWQPGFVRKALIALADRSRHWTYVSSVSVYASGGSGGPNATPLTEDARLLSPAIGPSASHEQYGSAKVACESTSAAVGDRLLIARPGLIGGPGDHTDRTGYWVARAARRPTAPMLVPDVPDLPTQVIDVRDVARWLVASAQAGLGGPRNAVGPVIPFDTWVASRRVGGHVGRVVRVAESRLSALGVQQWAGPDSLPLWVAEPGWEGFPPAAAGPRRPRGCGTGPGSRPPGRRAGLGARAGPGPAAASGAERGSRARAASGTRCVLNPQRRQHMLTTIGVSIC